MATFLEVMRHVLNQERTQIAKKYNSLGGLHGIIFEFDFQYTKLSWFSINNEKGFKDQGNKVIKALNGKIKEFSKNEHIEIQWQPETWTDWIKKIANGRMHLNIKCNKTSDQWSRDDELDLITKGLKTLCFYQLIDNQHLKRILEKYVREYHPELSEEDKQKKIKASVKTCTIDCPKSLFEIAMKQTVNLPNAKNDKILVPEPAVKKNIRK